MGATVRILAAVHPQRKDEQEKSLTSKVGIDFESARTSGFEEAAFV